MDAITTNLDRSGSAVEYLAEACWRRRESEHRQRLQPYALERTARMSHHRKHPIHDFLFEYYSFRPSLLLRWSPGPDCFLENARGDRFPWKEFEQLENGLILRSAAFPPQRRRFLLWALPYLQGIQERPPSLGCFGLHEWAMVYRTTDIRHTHTPLRLSTEEIAAIVEEDGVRCTHYDAFRFFTPEAMPLNRLHLTRETTNQHDQPGCVHVTMDLYRYAYKIAPWCPGELIADTFLLAWEARQLDMRASPYDLQSFGLEPICIETRQGREEYVARQRELSRKAEPLRARLIAVYQLLVSAQAS